MGSPNIPPPPDPYKTAQAQSQSNVSTSIANAYLGNQNTYGPLGSTTYNKTGTQTIYIMGGKNGTQKIPMQVPTWAVHQKLSPAQQNLLSLQQQAGGNLGHIAVDQTKKLGGLLNTSIDPSQLPENVDQAARAGSLQYAQGINPDLQTQVGQNDFSKDRQRVEEALYSRARPEMERQRAAMESRLANQGVTSGSEAWKQAMDAMGRQENDMRNQTILSGGQEQSRLFGMDLSKGQFGNEALNQMAQNSLNEANQRNAVIQGDFQNQNTADSNQQSLRQQQLQEIMALRNQPISEIAALMGGAAPTIPQFQQFNSSKMSETPVGQYVYNSANLAQQGAMAKAQSQNAMLGGLGSLGAGLFGLFSDRRLKENIKKVGTLDNGLPIYSYNFKGDVRTTIGVMADEVAEVMPEAVAMHPSGFLMVDYAQATGAI